MILLIISIYIYFFIGGGSSARAPVVPIRKFNGDYSQLPGENDSEHG